MAERLIAESIAAIPPGTTCERFARETVPGTEAANRVSCSWSAPRLAVLRGARIEGGEVVWPDGERYPIGPDADTGAP